MGMGTGRSRPGANRSVGADVVVKPTLAYPPLAKMAKIQGTVVVEITIKPDGLPNEAVAREGPIQLRKAAEDYAMQWKFEPQKENGVAQFSRFRLNIVFRLR